MEGEKSTAPLSGTLVAYYPGVAIVDFDPQVDARELVAQRQRIPQDWIVLAAAPNTIKRLMTELLLEKQKQHVEHTKGKGLWKMVKHKVFDNIVRAHRNASIIWSYWMPPTTPHEPRKRLAASCVMRVSKLGEDPEK